MENSTVLLGNELLQGEKVRLTTLTIADLPRIAAWGEDSASSTAIAINKKLATPEEWLADQQKNANYLFGIQTLEDQTLIGAGRLSDVMWQARHAQLTVTVEHPSFLEQGYAVDAISTFLRYAFMDVNLNRVYARVCSVEESAIEAYEQAGMQIEGQLRQAEFRDNRYCDVVVMGILQREWMETHLNR